MKTTLSIVIPAYNEEKRIGATLKRTLAYFADDPDRRVEALVVDDGSTDSTASLLASWQERCPQVRLLRHEQNMGKGRAVRTGMLAAGGEYVLFMDADGSTDICEIEKLLQALDDGADIAIGSRDVVGSEISKHQPLPREALGKLFNRAVRLLAVPDIADTQCGFKLFRKEAIKPLFSRQTTCGWAFDVEILYLALQMDYIVEEVPIQWRDVAGSRVRPIRDAFRTVCDLARIRLAHRPNLNRSEARSSDCRSHTKVL